MKEYLENIGRRDKILEKQRTRKKRDGRAPPGIAQLSTNRLRDVGTLVGTTGLPAAKREWTPLRVPGRMMLGPFKAAKMEAAAS